MNGIRSRLCCAGGCGQWTPSRQRWCPASTPPRTSQSEAARMRGASAAWDRPRPPPPPGRPQPRPPSYCPTIPDSVAPPRGAARAAWTLSEAGRPPLETRWGGCGQAVRATNTSPETDSHLAELHERFVDCLHLSPAFALARSGGTERRQEQCALLGNRARCHRTLGAGCGERRVERLEVAQDGRGGRRRTRQPELQRFGTLACRGRSARALGS